MIFLLFFSLISAESELKVPKHFSLIHAKGKGGKIVDHYLNINNHYFRKSHIKRFKEAYKSGNLTKIEKLASKDFPPAIHYLGEIEEIKKNYTGAFSYFKRAADLGYGESFSSVAFYLRYGFSINNKNDEIAENDENTEYYNKYEIQKNRLHSSIYTKIGAEKNSIRSMLTLANDHHVKFVAPKSIGKAVNILYKICEAFSTCYGVNKCFKITPNQLSENLRLSQNTSVQKLLEHYQYLAPYNNDAKLSLAFLYYDSREVQNYTKAYELFNELKDNDKRALPYLGRMYHYGQYVQKNLTRAKELYNSSIDDDVSLIGLGNIEIDQNNYEKAEYYLNKVNKSLEISKFMIAVIHYKNNQTQGFKEFKEVADKYHLISAQFNTAVSFLLKDKEISLKYFFDIIQYGEWNLPANDADELFLNGDIEGALFQWLTLGDMGMKISAQNAANILLNNIKKNHPEPLFGWKHEKQIRVAKRMFIIAENYVSAADCDRMLGRVDECISTLSKISSSNSIEEGKKSFLMLQLLFDKQIMNEGIFNESYYNFENIMNEIKKAKKGMNCYNYFILCIFTIKNIIVKLLNELLMGKPLNESDKAFLLSILYQNKILIILINLIELLLLLVKLRIQTMDN